MNRRSFVLLGALLTVAGCVGGTPALGPDGQPAMQVYRIDSSNQDAIPYRLLDAINTLRGARQLQPLALNAQLNAAAATHARDMSVQNRPWHFGSDGSSPLTRVQRVGYTGRLVGELISETFQTELETLSAWMSQDDTRLIILDPTAREIGFAWFQEQNGKIWWTLVTGA